MEKSVRFTKFDVVGDREIRLTQTADGLFSVVLVEFDGTYFTNRGARVFNKLDNARNYANNAAKLLVTDGWTMRSIDTPTVEDHRKRLQHMTNDQLAAVDSYVTGLVQDGVKVHAAALVALAAEILDRQD